MVIKMRQIRQTLYHAVRIINDDDRAGTDRVLPEHAPLGAVLRDHLDAHDGRRHAGDGPLDLGAAGVFGRAQRGGEQEAGGKEAEHGRSGAGAEREKAEQAQEELLEAGEDLVVQLEPDADLLEEVDGRRDLREAADRDSARTVAAELGSRAFTIKARAGSEGRLFGSVTAADIAPPAGVEVHNPELHIATLNGKGKLEIELVVERGRGYVRLSLTAPDARVKEAIERIRDRLGVPAPPAR